ncbi:MAG: hypothetical protein ACLP01_23645 [Solirubrobacteraceae bacterium]
MVLGARKHGLIGGLLDRSNARRLVDEAPCTPLMVGARLTAAAIRSGRVAGTGGCGAGPGRVRRAGTGCPPGWPA